MASASSILIPLPPLARVALEIGAEALRMQPAIADDYEAYEERGQTPRFWRMKPQDGGPLTDADTALNHLLLQRLHETFPGIRTVSEESPPEVNALALDYDERFYVDPLDNTWAYLKGGKGFSVNIGYVEDGVPVAGAVYFPALKQMFFTGNDGRAYEKIGDGEAAAMLVTKPPLRNPLQVAVGTNHKDTGHLEGLDIETRLYRAQGRTCVVAKGECDITCLTGRGLRGWDTAGPHAVLRAAGGEMITFARKPMRYHDDGVLPMHVAGGIDTLTALDFIDEGAFLKRRDGPVRARDMSALMASSLA